MRPMLVSQTGPEPVGASAPPAMVADTLSPWQVAEAEFLAEELFLFPFGAGMPAGTGPDALSRNRNPAVVACDSV